jgi:hypothetical protein
VPIHEFHVVSVQGIRLMGCSLQWPQLEWSPPGTSILLMPTNPCQKTVTFFQIFYTVNYLMCSTSLCWNEMLIQQSSSDKRISQLSLSINYRKIHKSCINCLKECWLHHFHLCHKHPLSKSSPSEIIT